MSSNLRHRKQGKSSSKSPVEQQDLTGEKEDQRQLSDDKSEKNGSSSAPVDKNHEAFLIRPLRECMVIMRFDVAPFALLYSVLLWIDNPENTFVSAVWCLSLLAHVSIVLACQWRVTIKAMVGFSIMELPSFSPTNMKKWTHCLIQSTQDTSVAGIVPIYYEADSSVAVISFQDQFFRCSLQLPDQDVALWQASESASSSPDQNVRFRPVKYPVDLPLSFYNTWNGHKESKAIAMASILYGPNTTVLQLPKFEDLLFEQLLAPFFLFQIFCVVLWSLDEYWYYAIFTLLALLLFESTVAYNRLMSLQRLHRAGNSGHESIWVRRSKQWQSISTRELIPGDWLSLSMNRRNTTVPADLCLLSGRVVVDEALLTGESTPQLKHSLEVSSTSPNDAVERMDLATQKESLLFGGTNLLVCTPEEEPNDNAPHLFSPDGGVVAMVLRTGFETAQGNLLRTMAHSTKSSDGVHTWETFVFIFLLLCFAVTSAAWVLHEGWYDHRRNRFRLLLHVVIIVTSVVPPELPMELSLAVTNSVSALMKRSQVFCTEHFRIPWAGQVTVCCFDKTGTLTSDEMRLRGVRVVGDDDDADSEDEEKLRTPEDDEIPQEALFVMAACHSLAVTEASRGMKSEHTMVVGDPLEKAVFSRLPFEFAGRDSVVRDITPIEKQCIRIMHRFAFSSSLKRMTTIAVEERKGQIGRLLALTKGAPEIVKSLLKPGTVPRSFDDITYHHMSRGRRVLAMAYREVGEVTDISYIKANGRGVVEKDLFFAGFLVLDCPIKNDTKSVILELRQSGHDCVMITGDALLTAAEVARQVGILDKTKLQKAELYRIVVDFSEKSENIFDILSFKPMHNSKSSKGSMPMLNDIRALTKACNDGRIALCLSGDTLSEIAARAAGKRWKDTDEKHMLLSKEAQRALSIFTPLVSVFARHAPHHKEAVIASLNHAGALTLMCGDGTNDVGALKRAHVGISIISAPQVEARQREASTQLKRIKKSKKAKKSDSSGLEASLRQLKEAQKELENVELGDASVAAPFTSRAISIKCCKDVVQQGRCTLVTTLSIFKILGINCLVNAVVLSRLFMQGVKQGERQMTALGMGVAGLFYFVTRAEPLPTLSHIRPPSSVLSTQGLLSIAGQFTVHVIAILLATEATLAYVDPFDPSMVPDGQFNPNPLNTCTFLLTCLATINTFAVNYRGNPFMERLSQNKLLYRSLQVSYGVLAACVLEVFPPLNDLLQLSGLPDVSLYSSHSDSILAGIVQQTGFSGYLACLMVVDTALVFGLESFLNKL